ncbi:MAG: hypothetical protein GY832_05840 [Chloroflexi bacterium]|nr:hypothetical protein [Chloroflexota bacterium]
MITPGISSPLRPIIAAFYETAHQVEPGWGAKDCSHTLRQILVSNGLLAEMPSSSGLDMIVNQRIGVTILPSATLLTDDTRRRVRQMMSGTGALRVVLIMAFLPYPRLARVDAPRNPGKEVKSRDAPSQIEQKEVEQ